MSDTELLTLKMTRRRALELGLIVCECGHPANNHFGHGLCSRCECKELRETGKDGITIENDRHP